jgi:hypothetical protein
MMMTQGVCVHNVSKMVEKNAQLLAPIMGSWATSCSRVLHWTTENLKSVLEAICSVKCVVSECCRIKDGLKCISRKLKHYHLTIN